MIALVAKHRIDSTIPYHVEERMKNDVKEGVLECV